MSFRMMHNHRSVIRGRAAAGGVAAFLMGALAAPAAWADGKPEPWQMGYQEAASPVMERIADLNDFITAIMFGIVILVMVLLAYVIFRFNAKKNPTPSKFTHNQWLELAWTAAPVAILVAIAIPSFKLLYFMDRAQDADMTLKVTGHQWYWSYAYPDHGGFSFDSFMKYPDSLEEGEPRLLATDQEVVLPVDTTVRVVLTSTDVIHAWAVPALGVKSDTLPGRLNETWLRIDKPGMYYGQCSELCGLQHGFMPVAIRAVPKDEFDAWVETAQAKWGDGDAPVELAATD